MDIMIRTCSRSIEILVALRLTYLKSTTSFEYFRALQRHCEVQGYDRNLS